MSGVAPNIAEARPGMWPMYRAMVGVGLVCGLLIVTVFQTTLPIIERNQAEALQKAVFQVLPDARSSRTFVRTGEDTFVPLEGKGKGAELVYGGFDEAGALVGVAIEAGGMGYADVIHVLYGYSFDQEAIVGIRVLGSKETPGLGDKIETDEAFQQNFVRLDASLDPATGAAAHGIVAVKSGTKQNPWEIDGITGATISSKAMADLLRKSIGSRIPLLRDREIDFHDRENDLREGEATP